MMMAKATHSRRSVLGSRSGLVPAVAALVMTSVVASTPSLADPGQSTWTTYLYEGPGAHYMVVDEMPQGTSFDIVKCAQDWCEVSWGERRGFLRQEIVAHGNPATPEAGVLAQPAAAIVPVQPAGPCIEANQTSGNGGNAPTVFCQK